MERALAGVTAELAAERPWKDLEPRIRRGLRKPYLLLALTLLGAAALGALAVLGNGSWTWALGVLLVFLPDRVKEVVERRRRIADDGPGDLLALYGEDLRKLRTRQLLRLVVDPLLVVGLLVGALLVARPLLPLLAAAILVVRMVLTVRVFFPRTGRELEALGLNPAAEDEDDAEEEEDDGVESWPALLASLGFSFVRVFVHWLGVPMGILAAWRATQLEEPLLPAVVAAILFAGCALSWIFAPEGDA